MKAKRSAPLHARLPAVAVHDEPSALSLRGRDEGRDLFADLADGQVDRPLDALALERQTPGIPACFPPPFAAPAALLLRPPCTADIRAPRRAALGTRRVGAPPLCSRRNLERPGRATALTGSKSPRTHWTAHSIVASAVHVGGSTPGSFRRRSAGMSASAREGGAEALVPAGGCGATLRAARGTPAPTKPEACKRAAGKRSGW